MRAGRSLLALLVGIGLLGAALWLIPARERTAMTVEVCHWVGLAVEGDLLRARDGPQSVEADSAQADAQAGGEARVSFVDGVPVVQLSAALQKKTGIRLEPAVLVVRRPEFRAYGEVADIGPLILLRSRQGTAQSARDIAAAALVASDHELKRLRLLRKDGASVPAKQMQQAQAQYEGDRARLEAAGRQLHAIREEAAQKWGPVLAGWALDGDSPAFDRLLQRKDVLVLVGLPTDRDLPEGTSMVYIDRNGDRAHARKAFLVAAAPQTDTATQGETWYFRAQAPQLRTDMHLDVWVPQSGPGVAGVEVPYSAVVWYAGKPWIYVEQAPDRFVRRAVGRHTENGREWFVRAGLRSGERIVVTGGQMLLSEEFRWQIPEEDND